MFVIGLTGGIGTGKSAVSAILGEMGAAVISADLIGHEVYRPHSEGWRQVVSAFGKEILASDGTVDRRKLGSIVFSNPQALQRLNEITHPRIYSMLQERIQELKREKGKVAVVEAALLIEAHWTPLVNEVWVITAPEKDVVGRLKTSRGLDDEAALSRVRAQMTQEERVRYADVVVENKGGLAELREQVRQLWNSRVQAQ